MTFVFHCTSCQARLETEGAKPGASVKCPNCGHTTRVLTSRATDALANRHAASGGGSKRAVVVVFIILGLCGVGAFVGQHFYSQREAELAREQKELRQRRAVEERERYYAGLWAEVQASRDQAVAETMTLPDALAAIQGHLAELVDTDYFDDVEGVILELKEMQQERLDSVLAPLDEEARQFTDKFNYASAAKLYDDYQGPYREETAEPRQARIDELTRQQTELDEDCRDFEASIAETVFRGDFESALVEFESFEFARRYTENLALTLQTLSDAEAEILSSFEGQVGQFVDLVVDGEEHRVRIGAVLDQKVVAQKRVGDAVRSRPLALHEIGTASLQARMKGGNAEGQAIYAGLQALKRGDLEQSRSLLADGGILAKPLQPLVAAYEEELREEEAAANNAGTADDQDAATITKGPPSLTDRTAPTGTFPDPKLLPHRIELRAIIHRKTRHAGNSDYDDQRQRISARVHIRNHNAVDLVDCKAQLYLIGRAVVDNNQYKVLERIEKLVNVPAHRDYSTDETDLAILFDDNKYAKYGHTYYGYVIYLRDSKGKLLISKSNKGRLRRIEEKVSEFSRNQSFTRDGVKVSTRFR